MNYASWLRFLVAEGVRGQDSVLFNTRLCLVSELHAKYSGDVLLLQVRKNIVVRQIAVSGKKEIGEMKSYGAPPELVRQVRAGLGVGVELCCPKPHIAGEPPRYFFALKKLK